MPSHELGIKKSLEPWNRAVRKRSRAAQPCDNAIPEQIVLAQDISGRQKHLCFAFPIYPGLHSKTVSCTATALSTCERAANPLMLIRLSQQTGAPLGLLLCESPGYGALLKQPDKHKSTRVFSDPAGKSRLLWLERLTTAFVACPLLHSANAIIFRLILISSTAEKSPARSGSLTFVSFCAFFRLFPSVSL